MVPKFGRIHIQAIGGVAGDMLLGGLLDLGAPRDQVQEALSSLCSDLPLRSSKVCLHGTEAVSVQSIEPCPEHHHRTLASILDIIRAGALTPACRKMAEDIFHLLSEAEAIVHESPVAEVHLHEVGQLDSILDVVGIAVALDLLGRPSLSCSPLPSGKGVVNTAHGLLECPVPAVVEIARRHGVPLTDVEIEGETITPTGIAVLAACCKTFVDVDVSTADRVGAGAGTRRMPDRPNIVQLHGWLAP